MTRNFDQSAAFTSMVELSKTWQETPRLCSYFVISGGVLPIMGFTCRWGGGGRVGTAFFRLQVHESEEISLAEVNER